MNEPTPIVHLVDDDASCLKSTERLLRASGFTVKTFSSAREFLAQVKLDAYGCIIADLRMPGLSGLDLQAALARSGHGMPIIFLTGEGDIPSSVRAMRSGAEDFLEKRMPPGKLFDAVHRAMARVQSERGTRERLQDLRTRFETLSVREREVLGQLMQGKLGKQIAAHLGIGERTVKAHRSAITVKLGVPSMVEITRVVQELGLLDEIAPVSPKVQ